MLPQVSSSPYLAPAGRPCCHLCHRPLGSDHCGESVCSPCRAARRDYNPNHDPEFADRLLQILLANRNRPVHVYRELGIESCGIVAWRCVRTHIRRFRRHGHVILGAHDGTYEWRGCWPAKGA